MFGKSFFITVAFIFSLFAVFIAGFALAERKAQEPIVVLPPVSATPSVVQTTATPSAAVITKPATFKKAVPVVTVVPTVVK